MPRQQDTIKRQWHMLRLIPRAPGKITARELHSRLLSHGYDIKKRTIERDLIDLSTTFPLIADDRERPFGRSWEKDAPTLDIPRLTPEEALALKLMEECPQKARNPKLIYQVGGFGPSLAGSMSS